MLPNILLALLVALRTVLHEVGAFTRGTDAYPESGKLVIPYHLDFVGRGNSFDHPIG